MLLLIGGCAPATSRVDPEIEGRERSLPLSDKQSAELENVHDFGAVFAHGQTLRHEFTLHNASDRPLRILGAEALTPCCSAVDKLPDSVPAGGEIKVRVQFRAGHQSGHKQVQFAVKTDEASHAVRLFSLIASLVAEVSVAASDSSGLSLLMGESGQQRLRVTTRHYKNEGLTGPKTIKASGDTKAQFFGEAYERRLENGVIETTQDVAVDIPPRDKYGSHAETLTLGWPGGRSWDHVVHWRVVRHVTPTPEGLVIPTGDVRTRSILVRSRTSPFRIVAVEGLDAVPGLRASYPDESATIHVLRLAFDGVAPSSWSPFDLTIRTDHPRQPLLTVSVLITPPPGGDAP